MELALGVGYALADDFTAKETTEPCPKALDETLPAQVIAVNHGFNYKGCPLDAYIARSTLR